MTLEQLKIFAAVAERQHVTRAAAALHLTQSAVSAAVAALERELGQHLFHRVGRGIQLSEAGQFFLAEARAVLSRAAAAQGAMTEFAQLGRGRLTICASQTISSYFLPERLVRFHAAWPGIELAVSLGNTAQVARAVMAGDAELGLVEGPVNDAHLLAEPVGIDEMVIAVPAGHRWIGKRLLPPAELAAGPWVCREEGSGTRAAFIEAMTGLGVAAEQLVIAMTLPSNEAVRAAAEAGAGVAALSSLVCAESFRAGRLMPTRVKLPSRHFQAVQHDERYRSRAAAAFLGLLRSKAQPD